MDNAFSGSSGGHSAINRRSKDKASGKFSPSYGVHKGYIGDPNWPPPEFPEGGTAMKRKFRRITLKFNVLVGTEWTEVKGDISKGGAMFVLPKSLEQKYAHIHYGTHVARVEILSVHPKGKGIAHHGRFIDLNESVPLWNEVKNA